MFFLAFFSSFRSIVSELRALRFSVFAQRPRSANQSLRSTTHRAAANWPARLSGRRVTRQPGGGGTQPGPGREAGVSVSVRARTARQVPRRGLGTVPRKVPSPQPQYRTVPCGFPLMDDPRVTPPQPARKGEPLPRPEICGIEMKNLELFQLTHQNPGAIFFFLMTDYNWIQPRWRELQYPEIEFQRSMNYCDCKVDGFVFRTTYNRDEFGKRKVCIKKFGGPEILQRLYH
ncbi:uncharacterized protein LOC118351481 [Canis lupus dingo]|uniref:uncharacterized protein LOC118351481 n=1 Tax=Canis lupus dingo TaxID=286419 RepID=UPI0020C2E319|nr:uncharacterized protein LOC118351481 [Canis lupus dingo]